MNNAGDIVDFTAAIRNSKSFQYKQNKNQVKQMLVGQKNVQIMVPLKYLRNFQRTLEMTLITFEINIILIWSKECVIASNTAANQEVIFPKTDTKLYVLVVTLSTQDNAKQLLHLKSGFKKEELTGTNINKKNNKSVKPIFRLLN